MPNSIDTIPQGPLSPVTIKQRGREYVAIDAAGKECGSHPQADFLARSVEYRYGVEVVVDRWTK